MDMELISLVKVEDWYNDKSCIMRTLRKGKGRNAYTDSTVYFRIKIDVNGNEIFSNYPESDLPIEKQDDFKDKTIEERVDILKDDTMIKLRMNQYIMPSILQKLLKSMKKNMVVTMTTNRIKDKLHSNFVSDWLNQYEAFKEGDTVKFTVSLFGIDNTSYFYKHPAAEKLALLLKLKTTAGEFFKIGNYTKAAKVYQKANGYFNFGDVANNFLREDDTTEEFRQTMDELNTLKLTCFTNLVVCKFKVKEYQSVIAITEQIIDMAPNHAKALYFRGKSQYLVEEFEGAIATLTRLCALQPENDDFKAELDMAIKLKARELRQQQKVFSKMFKWWITDSEWIITFWIYF